MDLGPTDLLAVYELCGLVEDTVLGNRQVSFRLSGVRFRNYGFLRLSSFSRVSRMCGLGTGCRA